MVERPLKYRDLIKRLKRYGVFEDKTRGKGSERLLVRIIDGVKHSFPTKCHNEGDEKPRGVISAIRRKLRLTSEDGVTDEAFYGK
ncbi:MAG: hypothetical protein WDZ51_19710 [Pirellulaceae bacterium]